MPHNQNSAREEKKLLMLRVLEVMDLEGQMQAMFQAQVAQAETDAEGDPADMGLEVARITEKLMDDTLPELQSELVQAAEHFDTEILQMMVQFYEHPHALEMMHMFQTITGNIIQRAVRRYMENDDL